MEVWSFLNTKEKLEIDSASPETHKTTLKLQQKNRLILDHDIKWQAFAEWSSGNTGAQNGDIELGTIWTPFFSYIIHPFNQIMKKNKTK